MHYSGIYVDNSINFLFYFKQYGYHADPDHDSVLNFYLSMISG